MIRAWIAASIGLATGIGTAAPALGAEAPLKWQFAGENQGIRFHFRIGNECRDSGAIVDVKLENTLDHDVTVGFRLMDPDWKQAFEKDLGPGMADTAIQYLPEDGKACHPYVDGIYVEPGTVQLSHSEESLATEKAAPKRKPEGD